MELQGPRRCIWGGPEEVKDLSGQDKARSRRSLQERRLQCCAVSAGMIPSDLYEYAVN